MVDGVECTTFREACLMRNLLQDDNAQNLALQEASISISAKQMRSLFAIIVVHSDPSNPLELWLNHKDNLSEDYVHAFNVTIDEAFKLALLDIEDIVIGITGKGIDQFGLLKTDRAARERTGPDYCRETNYDVNEMKDSARRNVSLLNTEQLSFHEKFVNSALQARGEFFFLDAPGDSGKTFLIKTILASLRGDNKIAIATASSGIAATLLPGGRTLHSTFKIPLDLGQSDQPICSIKKGTSLARLIKECSVIIVDEAPMSNKIIFEALNRSLKDIRGNVLPMGGITTLLCGDFRQILPVVRIGDKS